MLSPRSGAGACRCYPPIPELTDRKSVVNMEREGAKPWNLKQRCTRSTPAWHWTASIICSGRNLDVRASGFTDSCGLPGSSRGDTESTKSPSVPGTVLPAPNLLQRKFSLDQSKQARVNDITYIPIGAGWLYLSIVNDLCARKTVGYAFSARIDTSLTLSGSPPL